MADIVPDQDRLEDETFTASAAHPGGVFANGDAASNWCLKKMLSLRDQCAHWSWQSPG